MPHAFILSVSHLVTHNLHCSVNDHTTNRQLAYAVEIVRNMQWKFTPSKDIQDTN